jgi:hypothetical protein
MPREYLSVDLVRRVREAAKNRCGYCLSPQHLVMARLEIEHIIPLAKGGTDDESNLWLSCPRLQQWTEHFSWSADGLRIIGLTPVGRATVAVLQLAHAQRPGVGRVTCCNLGYCGRR